MSGETGPVVAIGIGNTLLGDDGVGARVIAELGRIADRDPRALPAGTRLVDGGTRGLDLLPLVRDARAVLLVDGLDLGRRPGSVEILRDDAARRTSGAVGELLAFGGLMGWLPDALSLAGVQVESVAVGAGLSTGVEAAVPEAVEASRRELIALDARTGGVAAGGRGTGPGTAGAAR
jgi:hydrogenase maturation protease